MVRVDQALREAVPDVAAPAVRVIESGWDNQVLDVDGAWIIRVARNDWALEGQRIETKLLSRLAPSVPLEIPVPVRSGEGWVLTRRIDGTAVDGRSTARRQHLRPESPRRTAPTRLVRRAFVHHALGPWHEVVEGLHSDPRRDASGLAGVRARLRKATEGAGTMGW